MLFRSGASVNPALLRVGELRLDLEAHEVYRGTESIRLTPTEYRLLEMLMRSPGRVVPRAQLVDAGWDGSAGDAENRLDVTMSSLRTKVDPQREFLQTVRGFGYKILDRP